LSFGLVIGCSPSGAREVPRCFDLRLAGGGFGLLTRGLLTRFSGPQTGSASSAKPCAIVPRWRRCSLSLCSSPPHSVGDASWRGRPSGGMGTRSRNSALAEALWEAFLHFVLFSGKHR